MRCEGLTALLDYMDKEGIDPGRHAVEFGQYEANLCTNGIEIDINGESNIRGLFAAGDMMGNISGDIGAAAVYGWIAGHHAGDYKTLGQPARCGRCAFLPGAHGILQQPV